MLYSLIMNDVSDKGKEINNEKEWLYSYFGFGDNARVKLKL
jgi:hypothetical protein